MSLVAWQRAAAALVNRRCLVAVGAHTEISADRRAQRVLNAHIKRGFAPGAVERGSRPAILPNMPAIREEGVDLDSALMCFAGTIR